MGRDSFVIKSKLLVKIDNASALVDALEFYIDDEKTDLENLKDCLEDYNWIFNKEENGVSEFILDDELNDAEFDWDDFRHMAAFLEDGSFVEEEPPFIEDKDGNECDGVFIGKVIEKTLDRAAYTVTVEKSGDKKYKREQAYN